MVVLHGVILLGVGGMRSVRSMWNDEAILDPATRRQSTTQKNIEHEMYQTRVAGAVSVGPLYSE